MSRPGQEQEPVPLEVSEATKVEARANGRDLIAIRTGNNAAWLCACKYNYPLVGRSGFLSGPSLSFVVQCEGCGKCYFVVPEGHDQGKAVKVIEIDKREIPEIAKRSPKRSLLEAVSTSAVADPQ